MAGIAASRKYDGILGTASLEQMPDIQNATVM